MRRGFILGDIMVSTVRTELKRIEVLLFAPETLSQECILILLRDKELIRIVGWANNEDKLLEHTFRLKPDVVLFYLSNQNFEIINLIPELHKASAQTKVVILSGSDDIKIQAKALELGAAGMVQKERGIQTLTSVIEQINDGKVVVNPKLLQQLLKKGSGNHNKTNNKKSTEIDSLTERELDVIEMIARGMRNKEIAERLFISEATVRHHLSSIYSKLMIDDRLNLVIYAYQHKLVKL